MIRFLVKVSLTLAAMLAGNWIAGHPSVPAASGSQMAPRASASVHASEALLERIERATDDYRAVPAQPGQRPAFIPRRVVTVKGSQVGLCSLDQALTGRYGSPVAWVR